MFAKLGPGPVGQPLPNLTDGLTKWCYFLKSPPSLSATTLELVGNRKILNANTFDQDVRIPDLTQGCPIVTFPAIAIVLSIVLVFTDS